MRCQAVEDHNAWLCTDCTQKETQALNGFKVIDAAQLLVNLEGINRVNVGVQCGMGGCKCGVGLHTPKQSCMIFVWVVPATSASIIVGPDMLLLGVLSSTNSLPASSAAAL